jgi:hypothetical protein
MPKNATAQQRIAWHRAHQEHCGCRPIPSKLLEQIESPGRPRSTDARRDSASLRALLAGGDRRSVAQSQRARALVEESRHRISELAKLAEDGDWLVSMRAMDLLEKLARAHPDWVRPHRRLFIGPLADSEEWEFHLQVVRALPLLEWTPRERKRAVEILRRDLEHPQKFVRAWALDGLATFAQRDRSLMPLVLRSLAAFERSDSRALATRAKHIRARIREDAVP